MTFIKIAGLSILMTVFFQETLTLEETLLSAEIGKVGGLKTPEKRTNNFRVPKEMPFDPNFWPARGRRNRRGPEKANPTENCIAFDGDVTFDKSRLRCPEIVRILGEELGNRKSGPIDFEVMSPINSDYEPLSGSEKTTGDFYGNAMTLKTREELRGGSEMKIPTDPGTKLLMKGLRPKKQKLLGLPEIILYGKEVFWAPENMYGEKKKKEDVFWVARGKKSFSQK